MRATSCSTRVPFLLLLTGAVSLPTYASGLFLGEAGYANLGAAGAGDGVYLDSPSAVWANPATQSFMADSKHTIAATVLNLSMDYYRADGSLNAESNSTLPLISYYSNHQINPRWSWSLAATSRGGATLDYGYEWDGKGLLTDIALLTYQVNPSLAYRINEHWSVAAGVQLDMAYFGQNTSLLEFQGDESFAAGYNLGVMYRATDKLDLGLSYRSKVEHEFDSDANIYNPKQTNTAPLGNYQVGVSLPATADLSARYQLNSNIALMTSVQWHQWSDWQQTEINLNNAPLATINREFDDVWHYALGTELALSQQWSMKLGYSYETSPLSDPANQSPDLPVGDQHRYSIGFAKQFSDSKLDLYYQFTDFGEMDSDKTLLRGSYQGNVHFIGAAYTY